MLNSVGFNPETYYSTDALPGLIHPSPLLSFTPNPYAQLGWF
jgi:hypothetical protein